MNSIILTIADYILELSQISPVEQITDGSRVTEPTKSNISHWWGRLKNIAYSCTSPEEVNEDEVNKWMNLVRSDESLPIPVYSSDVTPPPPSYTTSEVI